MAPLQLDLGILIILKGCQNCQLSTVNCQFGEAAKQQFICPTRENMDDAFLMQVCYTVEKERRGSYYG